jgi:hypothetical protein
MNEVVMQQEKNDFARVVKWNKVTKVRTVESLSLIQAPLMDVIQVRGESSGWVLEVLNDEKFKVNGRPLIEVCQVELPFSLESEQEIWLVASAEKSAAWNDYAVSVQAISHPGEEAQTSQKVQKDFLSLKERWSVCKKISLFWALFIGMSGCMGIALGMRKTKASSWSEVPQKANTLAAPPIGQTSHEHKSDETPSPVATSPKKAQEPQTLQKPAEVGAERAPTLEARGASGNKVEKKKPVVLQNAKSKKNQNDRSADKAITLELSGVRTEFSRAMMLREFDPEDTKARLKEIIKKVPPAHPLAAEIRRELNRL